MNTLFSSPSFFSFATHEQGERLKQLDALFEKAEGTPKVEDIPEQFIDSISFELMKDPVITPSGITFERETIVEHLRKVGHFDPVTRQVLSEDQLISNFALKEVLDHYLERYTSSFIHKTPLPSLFSVVRRNGWVAEF